MSFNPNLIRAAALGGVTGAGYCVNHDLKVEEKLGMRPSSLIPGLLVGSALGASAGVAVAAAWQVPVAAGVVASVSCLFNPDARDALVNTIDSTFKKVSQKT